jgi:DNA-binding transcriptional LysR family regulator
MDKLLAMKAFVLAAERGSLKLGAQALGRSPPTMVRILAELEQELGVVLLRRSTRRMSLTEEGTIYLERCRQILAAIRDAECGLVSEEGAARGQLRVTAPSLFGQLHVIPEIIAFSQLHPAIQIDVELHDRVVNLVQEGIDAAIRIGPLTDSQLVVRAVSQMHRTVVASPELLARVGCPKHPGELAKLPCVQFSGMTSATAWRFEEGAPDGIRREFSVTVEGRLRVNQAAGAVQACIAGLGFGRFAAYQTASAIREGKLCAILRSFECAPIPVSVVHPPVRIVPPRLRVFLDWMVQRLRARASGGWHDVGQHATTTLDAP